MNKKTKKIIAREFLFLIGTIILLFSIFFCWIKLHEFNINNQEAIKKEMTKINSCELLTTLRTFVLAANSGKYKTEDEIMSKFPELHVYDRQVLREFVATKNSGDFETEFELLSKFPEFGFDKNGFYSKINKKDYLLLQQKNNELNKLKDSFFSNKVDDDNFIALLIILPLITFLLRYLIYAIQWSVIQLKN